MKNLLILVYSVLVIFVSFLVIFMIADIGNSVQLLEIDLRLRLLLYIPVFPILIAWICCIFKYFKPPKKAKNTKPFATPSIDTQIDNPKIPEIQFAKKQRLFYRTFLLLGIPVGLTVFITSAIMYYNWEYQNDRNSKFSDFRNDLLNESETTLSALGSKLAKYISDNPDEVKNLADSKWHSVFKSNLSCFEAEKQALNKIESIINDSPHEIPMFLYKDSNSDYSDSNSDYSDSNSDYSDSNSDYSDSNSDYSDSNSDYSDPIRKALIIFEPFEYKIISDKTVYCKVRYNTEKQVFNDYDPEKDHKLYYDGQDEKFYAAFNYHRKFKLYTDNYLFTPEVGILEFNSESHKCRFIYDNWWDNFIDSYKWVAFLIDFIAMVLIFYTMAHYSKRFNSKRMKKYNQQFFLNLD